MVLTIEFISTLIIALMTGGRDESNNKPSYINSY